MVWHDLFSSLTTKPKEKTSSNVKTLRSIPKRMATKLVYIFNKRLRKLKDRSTLGLLSQNIKSHKDP